jgi:phosphatidylglycerophosphate synthase
MDRRPARARETNIVKKFARFCAGVGVTPNQLSIASIFFSLLAGACYFLVPRYSGYEAELYLLAVAFICIRALCNLADGLVAIEYGRQTRSGEIYNDAPDRISDIFILVGAGFSVKGHPWATHIGWLAASMAVMTAYIRVLGRSVGARSYFTGPMAKNGRFWTIVLASLLETLSRFFTFGFSIIYYSLWIIAVGSAITCLHRLRLIVNEIGAR